MTFEEWVREQQIVSDEDYDSCDIYNFCRAAWIKSAEVLEAEIMKTFDRQRNDINISTVYLGRIFS